MVKVTVELISGIDESRNRLLGTAIISNDLRKTVATSGRRGAYNVRLLTGDPPLSKKAGRLWRSGKVKDFPRRLGPWDLLYRALKEIVGDRNE